MELSTAYNEIHRLFDETNAQRKAFEEAARKLRTEMEIVCTILGAFSSAVIYQDCCGKRFINADLFPLGEKEIRFRYDSREYKRLTEMKKEELENLVNLYSPEELEIVEVTHGLVKVKLKAFEWTSARLLN